MKSRHKSKVNQQGHKVSKALNVENTLYVSDGILPVTPVTRTCGSSPTVICSSLTFEKLQLTSGNL